MNKLTHSNQETMDQIERDARVAEERGERGESPNVGTSAVCAHDLTYQGVVYCDSDRARPGSGSAWRTRWCMIRN